MRLVTPLSRLDPLINQFLHIEKESEILIIQLIIEGYLRVQVQQTQYRTNAYLIPSLTAPRITRHPREDLAKCDYSIRCHFPMKVKITKGKARAPLDDEGPPPQGIASTSRARPPHLTKRKRKEVDDQEDDENVIEISSDVVDDDEIFEADHPPRPLGGQKLLGSSTRGAEPRSYVIVDSEPEGWSGPDSEEGDIWMYSHRPKPRQRRRTKSPSTMADLPDF